MNNIISFASIIAMAFLFFIGAPGATVIIIACILMMLIQLLISDNKLAFSIYNYIGSYMMAWIVFYGAYYAFLTYLQ